MNGSHGKRMVREDWIRKPRHCHYVVFIVETNIMVGMYLYNDSKENVTSSDFLSFITNIGDIFYPVFQLENLAGSGNNYKLCHQIRFSGGLPKLGYTEFDLGTGTWSSHEVTIQTIPNITLQKLIY